MLLHLALIAVVSLCLAAGWWQVGRARSGNLLSYGYAVEWPVFAVIAGVMWWQMVHEAPEHHHRLRPDEALDWDQRHVAQQLPRSPDAESPELRAYNDELAALAVTGRPKTWRSPRGSP